jgi:hypothetical protein
MSRSPTEAPEDTLDLERLVIDPDYRQEVIPRLKAESLARRADRLALRAKKAPTSRQD